MENSSAKTIFIKLSIRNEDPIAFAVRDFLLHSTAAQTTAALRLFPSELVGNVVQDCMGRSQNKFAKIPDDGKRQGTNHSLATADASMITAPQLFTDNDICGRHCTPLYADNYIRNLLAAKKQSLRSIGCFVKFREPGELNIKEDHGTMKDNVLQIDYEDKCFFNVQNFRSKSHFSYEWQNQVVCLQSLELCRTDTLRKLFKPLKWISPSEHIYVQLSTNQTSILNSLTQLLHLVLMNSEQASVAIIT